MNKIFYLFIISFSLVFSQENITISGDIRDKETGETLIGATIYIPQIQKGTTSNSYGFFSITVPLEEYKIEISYVGYITQIINYDNEIAYENLSIELQSDKNILVEIELNDKRQDVNIKSTDIGKVELEVKQINQIPVIGGEKDILKTIQLLPGIQSGGEGTAGFYVRGGGPDQNLILLDEAVVYNASHLFGFFSVFNNDAINNIELIKGSMPANYGGRLSSVLDINMKNGNNKKFGAEGGISLISSRLTLEGPIKKDTSSFIISGRRTYFDILAKPYIDTTSFAGSGYFFYDLTTKANYTLSKKDRLYLSGYFGRDVFSFNSRDWGFNLSMPWGNKTASLRWNHLFNSQLFMNTSIIFTDYRFELNASYEGDGVNYESEIFSGIRDWNIKSDISYFPEKHKIKIGANYTFHKFNPTSFYVQYNDSISENIINYYAHEYAFYINDEYSLSERLVVNAGLRHSGFLQTGPFTRYVRNNSGLIGQVAIVDSINYKKGEPVKYYGGFEPRFSMRYLINSTSSFKIGCTQNYQYIHLSSFGSSNLPTDLWLPSSDVVKPQLGRQISAGYYKNFQENNYETSAELYYKSMKNLVEYEDNYTPGSSSDNPDNYLTFGNGESYGLELFFAKRTGNLNGWIGYTLSKTTREFDELNNGKWFYAKYDRTHDISLVMNYQLSKRLNFSTVFVYATGNSSTLPESIYFINGEPILEWGSRNSYRMEPYHRMDVSLTLNSKENKKFKSSWTLSVYNVYNRKNPYFIQFNQEGTPSQIGSNEQETVQIKAEQVSLFPIIPSIAWNFKF
ncbi:MAG: TonB-dependent receptor [Flavobacteriales bacterium]|nr:TonB-dependent receptor [Flavobacteriales bacterium]|tara:strand:+ start:11735 stop:14119 length:2385 start_codon:yes stop_codon:yes gene_type:complete